MIKKISWILITLIFALSIAACGSGGEKEPEVTVNKITPEEVASEKEDAAKEEPAKKEEPEEPAAEEKDDAEEEITASDGEFKVNRQTVYDEGGIKIDATDMAVREDVGAVELYFEVENKTDESITITCETKVNGKEVESGILLSADPGETYESSGYIVGDSMEKAGIALDGIKKLEIKFEGVNPDKGYEEVFKTDFIEIKPGSGTAGSEEDDSENSGSADTGEITGEVKFMLAGSYYDGYHIGYSEADMKAQGADDMYIILKDDGTGYLHFGDDAEGDITWNGSGNDFRLKGDTGFESGKDSYLKDGELRLDTGDLASMVFLSEDADRDSIDFITEEEFGKIMDEKGSH